MQTKIWDARKLTDSSGHAEPVVTLLSERGGVRNLKFSPLGEGKPILAAAEAMDIVNVYDTAKWKRKQTIDFFGEVGGIDFVDRGRTLMVANCDGGRGGIMELERWGMGANAIAMPVF